MTIPHSLQRPFDDLTPDVVMDAVEAEGIRCNGSVFALNSYENRVYQIGVEDDSPIVAKFYRPQRWPDLAILEEHSFSLALVEQEIPVVAPAPNKHGVTLHTYHDYRYAIFPRRGGRWPELDIPENRRWLGRFLARIHNVGGIQPFAHRPMLDVNTFGVESYEFLLQSGFIPPEWQRSYRDIAQQVLQQVRDCYRQAGDIELLRIHGDCHPGNILWTDSGPHFVDLDDCRTGPAVQDLWMLLSGDAQDMAQQLSDILSGYEEFREFNYRERYLIEALRTLRLMHYSAWIARRWQDPAFPKTFPWFGEPRYWEEQINTLREQSLRMNEPALNVLTDFY